MDMGCSFIDLFISRAASRKGQEHALERADAKTNEPENSENDMKKYQLNRYFNYLKRPQHNPYFSKKLKIVPLFLFDKI